MNSIPELTRVAEDFDSLVDALTASQALIKQAAEENTHALKAPLAVIAQSIEPLKRAVAQSDATSQRSLQLIERSVARLDTLLSAARDVEQAAADVVFPARRPINLSRFLAQMLRDYDVTLAAQGKWLSLSIADGVTALASEDVLEPVIENLLENAASFTPKGGTIEVSRTQRISRPHPDCRPRSRRCTRQASAHLDRYVSYREEIPRGRLRGPRRRKQSGARPVDRETQRGGTWRYGDGPQSRRRRL